MLEFYRCVAVNQKPPTLLLVPEGCGVLLRPRGVLVEALLRPPLLLAAREEKEHECCKWD